MFLPMSWMSPFTVATMIGPLTLAPSRWGSAARTTSNAVPAAPFVHYAVPAMSDNQRLEDVYPVDGEAGEPVRIIAARDEYEPGAFLVYPLADLGKVAFSLTPFRNAEGDAFPKPVSRCMYSPTSRHLMMIPAPWAQKTLSGVFSRSASGS